MKRDKVHERKTALNDICAFFAKAKIAKDSLIAKHFVQKARKLAMKYRIHLPVSIKRQFCKHCDTFFVPSDNVRVRTSNGKVVYTCMICKKFMRFRYV